MPADWWQAKSCGTCRMRLESNKLHHHTATHQCNTQSTYVMPSAVRIVHFTFLRRRESTVVCIVGLVVHDKAVVNKIETVGASFIWTGNHLAH